MYFLPEKLFCEVQPHMKKEFLAVLDSDGTEDFNKFLPHVVRLAS
jgi:hypothetical protein